MKFWCWLRGHAWRVTHVNPRKHVNLIHLHTMAGCRATCMRCDAGWDDTTPGITGDTVTEVVEVMDLPRATMLER